MKVLYINRAKGQFWSIEELFRSVSKELPKGIASAHASVPRSGASVVSLIQNVFWSFRFSIADIVHVTGDVHYVLIGIWRSPTVLTIHDLRFIDDETGFRRFLFWLLWIYLPCKLANRVTVISEFTRRRLEAYVRLNAEKVRVIPDCVDPGFCVSPKPSLSSPPIVLHVGTTTNKNLERLIIACKGLDLELRVLGRLSEPQKALLRESEIRSSEYFDLDRIDVMRLYEQCDIVSFVSLYEGFGVPILEAQAVGRPVLTSDLAPMNEIAGAAALCVDPTDVTAIRNAIVRLIEGAELREELVRRGFENVKRYSASVVASQYAELYREMVER